MPFGELTVSRAFPPEELECAPPDWYRSLSAPSRGRAVAWRAEHVAASMGTQHLGLQCRTKK